MRRLMRITFLVILIMTFLATFIPAYTWTSNFEWEVKSYIEK